ncbi:hypothetical protein AM598_06815, partial [Paenibacillus polymyxa]
VKELLNQYVEHQGKNTWGRIEFPRETWKEFNEISIEEARINLKNVLSPEDYQYVKLMSKKLFNDDSKQGNKYLLHGDTVKRVQQTTLHWLSLTTRTSALKPVRVREYQNVRRN